VSVDEGAAGSAAWTESYAARILGLALAAQPEFFEHAGAVRDGADVRALAQRYVRRDQGRRVELIATYINTAASVPAGERKLARVRVRDLKPVSYWVEAPLATYAPKRALRMDAADSLRRAAIRVARRGAGRCADPSCCPNVGARLATDSLGDYCAACLARQPHSRNDVEGERELFDRAVCWVLGGRSRAQRRAAM
jgi:hypothetical protein